MTWDAISAVLMPVVLFFAVRSIVASKYYFLKQSAEMWERIARDTVTPSEREAAHVWAIRRRAELVRMRILRRLFLI